MGENREQPTQIWVPTIDLKPHLATTAQAADLRVLLQGRKKELSDAVASITELVGQAVDQAQEAQHWKLDSVQAAVGISFAAEAGVLIAKASTEGSFTLTLNFTRATAAKNHTAQPEQELSPAEKFIS